MFNISRCEKKFISYEPNHLQRLIKRYPNENWNDVTLARNPNMTLNFMLKFLANNVDKIGRLYVQRVRDNLLLNLNVSIEEIAKSSFFKEYELITINSREDIDIADVLKYPNLPWDMQHILCKKGIPLSFIKESLDNNLLDDTAYTWAWISQNPNITMNFVKENLNKEWNWGSLSRNGGITFQDVLDNPSLPWDWNNLSQNFNINMLHAIQLPTKNWNYHWLCTVKKVRTTLQDIKDNPTFPWDWKGLSYNIVTIDFIKDNLDKDWDWGFLTNHPYITVQDILENPDLPWEKDRIELNQHFTPKDFAKFPSRPHTPYFNHMPNLTCKDVTTLDLPWNFEHLSDNKFLYLPYTRKLKIKKIYSRRQRIVSGGRRMINFY